MPCEAQAAKTAGPAPVVPDAGLNAPTMRPGSSENRHHLTPGYREQLLDRRNAMTMAAHAPTATSIAGTTDAIAASPVCANPDVAEGRPAAIDSDDSGVAGSEDASTFANETLIV